MATLHYDSSTAQRTSVTVPGTVHVSAQQRIMNRFIHRFIGCESARLKPPIRYQSDHSNSQSRNGGADYPTYWVSLTVEGGVFYAGCSFLP